MRTIETKIYHYDELSESAKEQAREWYRECDPFGWSDDWLTSAHAFCAAFGVTLKEWSIGPWSPIEYRTDAENSHFRGAKLRDYTGEEMPTGFCGDCDAWSTFYNEFKRTGDAKNAFDAGLYSCLKAWRADWEYSLSDEAVAEAIEANGYEFTEDGERI